MTRYWFWSFRYSSRSRHVGNVGNKEFSWHVPTKDYRLTDGYSGYRLLLRLPTVTSVTDSRPTYRPARCLPIAMPVTDCYRRYRRVQTSTYAKEMRSLLNETAFLFLFKIRMFKNIVAYLEKEIEKKDNAYNLWHNKYEYTVWSYTIGVSSTTSEFLARF